MADTDYAKLKRLLAAVASTLDRVPDKAAHGLPVTYKSLRDQVVAAVPDGLRAEAEQIAPVIQGAPSRGARSVIDGARDGATAYAHLAALHGWLKAVIGGE